MNKLLILCFILPALLKFYAFNSSFMYKHKFRNSFTYLFCPCFKELNGSFLMNVKYPVYCCQIIQESLQTLDVLFQCGLVPQLRILASTMLYWISLDVNVKTHVLIEAKLLAVCSIGDTQCIIGLLSAVKVLFLSCPLISLLTP